MQRPFGPIVYVLAVILILTACSGNKGNVLSFGEAVDTANAIPVHMLANEVHKQSPLNCVVAGEAESVCMAEGCWLKIKRGNEEPVMVRMKDHKFTVTENVKGKFVFVKGKASVDSLSVDKLKEEAKNRGEDSTFISSIVQPKTEIVFEAIGIVAR